ncbi:hypothetical protein PT2222_220100 [Paraburkholderia tropica]
MERARRGAVLILGTARRHCPHGARRVSAVAVGETEREKLALAGDAEPPIRALLVRHDAARLDAHVVGDFGGAVAFEHAAQRVEFALREVRAETAQAREHQRRNAGLTLAAQCVVMLRGLADQRRERLHELHLAGLEIAGVALAIEIHGEPDVGGGLQQQREPVRHVGRGVAGRAIAVVLDIGAGLPVQHERVARRARVVVRDDALVAVERVEEARVGVGDVAQKAPAAMVGDRDRARAIAEFVREYRALRHRSGRSEQIEHFGGERVVVGAADRGHETGDAGQVELTRLAGTVETPVAHVS